MFLRHAKEAQQFPVGSHPKELLLTCRVRYVALNDIGRSPQYSITRIVITLVLTCLAFRMNIFVYCGASCGTEAHHLSMCRCTLTPCAPNSKRKRTVNINGFSTLQWQAPQNEVVVPELCEMARDRTCM